MKKVIKYEVDFGPSFPKEYFVLVETDGLYYPYSDKSVVTGWTEESLLKTFPKAKPTYEPCKCTFCKDYSPKIKAISEALSPELQKDFEHLMSTWGAESLDGEVAQSKLDGIWPDWNWLPKVEAIMNEWRNLSSKLKTEFTWEEFLSSRLKHD